MGLLQGHPKGVMLSHQNVSINVVSNFGGEIYGVTTGLR